MSKAVLPLGREPNFHKIKVIRTSAKNHPVKVTEIVPKSSKKHVWEPWKMQAEKVYPNLRNLIPKWPQHGSQMGPRILQKMIPEPLGSLLEPKMVPNWPQETPNRLE